MNITDHLTEPEQAELVRWCAGVDPDPVREGFYWCTETCHEEVPLHDAVDGVCPKCGWALAGGYHELDYLSDLNAAARILRAVIGDDQHLQGLFGVCITAGIPGRGGVAYRLASAPAWAKCLAAKRAVEAEGGE